MELIYRAVSRSTVEPMPANQPAGAVTDMPISRSLGGQKYSQTTAESLGLRSRAISGFTVGQRLASLFQGLRRASLFPSRFMAGKNCFTMAAKKGLGLRSRDLLWDRVWQANKMSLPAIPFEGKIAPRPQERGA